MPLVFVKEIKRKFIHLSSSIIPIFAFFFDRELTLIVLLLTTFIFIAFDYLRIKKNKFIIEWHNRFFNDITREKESKSFTGASYVFLSCLTVIFFFELKIACTSLFIMSISDSFSAIIGKKYGSVKIYKEKTFEGSLAFFFSSLIIILLVPGLNLFHAMIAILFTTFVELYSVDVVDDNLSIPISFSISMLILGAF